jgi:asparagine synthase (glutamine-hydrolysing)
MFAFLIWDGGRQRLFAARDRLGIKPLYYAEAGGRLLIGSELKAFVASGLIQPELDLRPCTTSRSTPSRAAHHLEGPLWPLP